MFGNADQVCERERAVFQGTCTESGLLREGRALQTAEAEVRRRGVCFGADMTKDRSADVTYYGRLSVSPCLCQQAHAVRPLLQMLLARVLHK